MRRVRPSGEPASDSPAKISRDEMLTKLRIFNGKFGTKTAPPGAELETVRAYYQDALDFIEGDGSKNCDILRTRLKEFMEDIDEEDPGRPGSGCCSRFWNYVFDLYARACICDLQTED